VYMVYLLVTVGAFYVCGEGTIARRGVRGTETRRDELAMWITAR